MSDTTSTEVVAPEAAVEGATTEPAPTEAAPEGAAAAPTAPKRPSDEWTKISAEEKRVRKEREKLEADRKSIDAERKAAAEHRELLAKAKAGDWDARQKLIEDSGLTYDEWTKWQLRGRKVDPNEKLAREVEALKAERQKEREEAQKREADAAWEATRSDFHSHVLKESPADYPLLAGEIEAEPDYIDSVLKSIERHAMESGQPTTIRDAALRLERYFREQTERRAARLTKPAAAPAVAPETSSDTKARPRDQQTGRFAGGDGPRRLTNDLSAERSAPPKGRDPSRPLTKRERDIEERERIRRAANAMSR